MSFPTEIVPQDAVALPERCCPVLMELCYPDCEPPHGDSEGCCDCNPYCRMFGRLLLLTSGASDGEAG